MKPGFKFKNENMDFSIILFAGTERKNVALLLQENTSCPFITVRDLSERKNGNYDWTMGHYFKSFNRALKDYFERQNSLRQQIK